ncbi:uncharacterized protein J8A68_003515 [[Candida] subhashii]|uniref:Uncharacterized protein n=1 Tax=[Candida] subhashii TaxID=561895 RepID=A0A8J5QVG2_9ASCO|nr:uncharacterized protein J8A68_003515 [[Candida] subhashii]KAG7662965.1 hypothetical protein J8A68_003515 [[Candida] subhashii]
MSGLASKWATDESLVEKALEQDSKVSHHKSSTHILSSSPSESDKWHKPITSKKSEQLQSKWASEPSPEPISPVLSPVRHSHRKDHDRIKQSYLTPPSPHEDRSRRSPPKKFQQTSRSRDPIDNRNPNIQKYNQTPDREDHRGHFEKRRFTNENVDVHDEDEDNDRGPMTDAAKAFAARLGIPDRSTGRQTFNKEGSADWEDVDDDSEEDVKHVSFAKGNSLASRLGKLDLRDTRKSTTHAKKISSRDLGRKNQPRNKKDRYQELAAKEKSAPVESKEEREARELAEEKAKQDMLAMLDKIDTNEIDWASYDD